ncbi:MAG: type VI secretion protein [Halomonadaceae bacterium]|nr:MAG: type VI secretion protein [Halomonadaceae bacterium]
MGKPAAVLGSFHTCPKTTGNTPHVGGPALATAANVTVGGLPIACVGDKLVCVGPPDKITQGSGTVTANGKPVARLGDGTGHGGKIVAGNPTVLVGG